MPAVLPRFYAPDLDADAGHVRLPADEARHLTRVLRLRAGDDVAVFDGRGVQFRARVEAAMRDTVSLQLLEPLPVPGRLATAITVAPAVLKGGSMDEVVRDATMMGASAIEPLLTAHTDVKIAVAMRPATLERWQRIALAAVKQSGRVTLPRVDPPRALGEWLATSEINVKLLFAEPSADAQVRSMRSLLAEPVPAAAAVLFGPEGGWAAADVTAALDAGCVPVTLGPLTLRAESMPVAALAALAAVWQR
jgi:16S rRNA (uracil1498-N3)-methyltransferase